MNGGILNYTLVLANEKGLRAHARSIFNTQPDHSTPLIIFDDCFETIREIEKTGKDAEKRTDCALDARRKNCNLQIQKGKSKHKSWQGRENLYGSGVVLGGVLRL